MEVWKQKGTGSDEFRQYDAEEDLPLTESSAEYEQSSSARFREQKLLTLKNEYYEYQTVYRL